MNRESVLNTLYMLECYRIAIEKGEVKSEDVFADNKIRLQQADVAGLHFESRKEWTNILKEQYGLVY